MSILSMIAPKHGLWNGGERKAVAVAAPVVERAAAVALGPSARPVGEIVARPVPTTAPELPDDYEAVAKRIGAEHLIVSVERARMRDEAARKAEARRVAMLTLLSEMGLRCYDEREVADYLKTQYGETPFGWRALRNADNPGDREFRREGASWNGQGWEQWGRDSHDADKAMRLIGGRDTKLYSKPVPLPVLLTVEQIASRIPEATFWVSDEARRIPEQLDPFLMVRLDGERYIVERWDEPNFRG